MAVYRGCNIDRSDGVDWLECVACSDLWIVSPWAKVQRDNYVCPECECWENDKEKDEENED